MLFQPILASPGPPDDRWHPRVRLSLEIEPRATADNRRQALCRLSTLARKRWAGKAGPRLYLRAQADSGVPTIITKVGGGPEDIREGSSSTPWPYIAHIYPIYKIFLHPEHACRPSRRRPRAPNVRLCGPATSPVKITSPAITSKILPLVL